jgi:hydroxyacylglutathione hydrolase
VSASELGALRSGEDLVQESLEWNGLAISHSALITPRTPIVLVGRDDHDAQRGAVLAAAVGITRIVGYLAGGMTVWYEELRGVQRTDRLEVEELHDRWDRQDAAVQVLDVRERAEWNAGHIPGSVHYPYHDINSIPNDLNAELPIAVICGSGQRAAVAASLLQHHGATNVIHIIDGGVPAWHRAGWPIHTSEHDAHPA